jgi:CRP-like cAMP-binding protein
MVDRRKPAGTCLFVAGEPADTLHYVKHGAVALSRASLDKQGEGTPHAIRRAGSLVGVEALVRDTYLDTARSVTDVTVCIAQRSDMLAFLDRTGAARALLELVLRASCADNPRRATADGSAPQRVAEWLLDGTERKAVRSIPRSVVAGLLGMKPETMSRAVASLAKRGAIVTNRMRIEVVDRALLRAIADGVRT